MDIEFNALIVIGIIFAIVCLGFTCYALVNPPIAKSYVGVLERVVTENSDITLVLDTGLVKFSLGNDQILQPPLQIGHKYQIDVTNQILFNHLRCITELPVP
jgi:hypothetical protein